MHIFVFLVRVLLPDQVSPVGGGIDQHILRFLFQSAFDHRFQVLILRLKFLKAQIIHVDHETIAPVLDLAYHGIEVLKLIFIDFDHSKSLFIIFIRHRLDTGGFTRSRISKKQAVVGRSPGHKGIRIIPQLLLGEVIADQIVKLHVGDIPDGLHMHTLIVMHYPEGLMETELSDTESLIKLRDDPLHVLGSASLGQFPCKIADIAADPVIIHLRAAVIPLILQDQRKLRQFQLRCQCLQIQCK